MRLAAFVAASGSAGTLGAGDYLKDRLGARIVAVEALECPTMLINGFGAHNIQGIGDKHIPLIHNVMNTDVVVDISDRHTDRLNVLFNTDVGRAFLASRGPHEVLAGLGSFWPSSICNVLAAIKTAKAFDLGPDDLIITVATDGAGMYATELDKVLARDFLDGFDEAAAAEVFGESLEGVDTDHLLDCTQADRARIFNLGYFTWVEQQGVALEDFEARRSRSFWRGLQDLIPAWDGLIERFNGRTGARRRGEGTSRRDRSAREPSPTGAPIQGGVRGLWRRGDALRFCPFRCPDAGTGDGDHLMVRTLDPDRVRFPPPDEPGADANPFVRYWSCSMRTISASRRG